MSRWTRLRPRTGRHLHVRSPLARLEWGTYGRRRRRLERGLIAFAVLALVGAEVASWFAFIRGNGTSAPPSPKAEPGCATAKLPGRLGQVAWVAGGRLQVQNLDTCA